MSYSYQTPFNNQHRTPPKPKFIEIKSAAFFIGKLNKHHDREKVYCQLKRLTRTHKFYIAKFDMPNGADGRGNKGFAFVHTKSTEEAQRIIAMGHLKLGNQMCEVKPYGGRTDTEESSGRETPDSGVNAWTHSPKQLSARPQNFTQNFTNNPLKNNVQFETRSRVSSGIRSESGRFSDGKFSRNNSESESIQKIPLESVLSHEENNTVKGEEIANNKQVFVQEINYEPAGSENETDQWLEFQTNYLMNTLNASNLMEFMSNCNQYLVMLKDLPVNRVQEVDGIQKGTIITQVEPSFLGNSVQV